MAKKKMNGLVGGVVGVAFMLGFIFLGLMLTQNTTAIPYIPVIIHQIAGWVIVVAGVLGGLGIIISPFK